MPGPHVRSRSIFGWLLAGACGFGVPVPPGAAVRRPPSLQAPEPERHTAAILSAQVEVTEQIERIHLVLAAPVDPSTVRPAWFRVVTQDGRWVRPRRAVVEPAERRRGMRGVVLDGDFGVARHGPPWSVTVVGPLRSSDGRTFERASAEVRGPADPPAVVVVDCAGPEDAAACGGDGVAVRVHLSIPVRRMAEPGGGPPGVVSAGPPEAKPDRAGARREGSFGGQASGGGRSVGSLDAVREALGGGPPSVARVWILCLSGRTSDQRTVLENALRDLAEGTAGVPVEVPAGLPLPVCPKEAGALGKEPR